MDTKTVYLSGVHGTGKTTLAIELCQKLEDLGHTAYYLREMSYPIKKYKYKTFEFQNRYMKEIYRRHSMIKHTESENLVDYLIIDRCIIDVVAYNENIEVTEKIDDVEFKERDRKRIYKNIFGFLIDSETDTIIERLQERYKQDTFRKDWKEDDINYISNITNTFKSILSSNDNDFRDTINSSVLKLKHPFQNPFFIFDELFLDWKLIENKSNIDNLVNSILKSIV